MTERIILLTQEEMALVQACRKQVDRRQTQSAF
jgi:hypothetical protein